ncbi:MAG: hypothetical protein V1835_00055 [Candidatus Micrarchaeota archaeon]
MDQIFGTWYENKFWDAAVKTILLLVVFVGGIWLYNFFGGRPVISLKDMLETLWQPILLVVVVGYAAFFYAGSAHRKYRKHLNQRAQHLTQTLRMKKRK